MPILTIVISKQRIYGIDEKANILKIAEVLLEPCSHFPDQLKQTA